MAATRPVHERSFKRSIDGIFTVFANLKNQRTGEVEKPLKSAFYNIACIVLLSALVGVIFVLLPFLNPLLWAFLFGAMLFPFKKKLSFAINSWIDDIEKEEIPIAVGLIMCPFNGLEKLGEVITLWLINHFKILLILSGSIILLRLIVAFVPAELFSAVFSIIKWQHSLFGAFVGSMSLTLVLVCVASYAIAVNLLWSSSNSNFFTVAGQSMWIFIVAFICSHFGAFQVPAFVAVMVYMFVGVLCDESQENSQNISKIKSYFGKAPESEPAVKPQSTETEPTSSENFPSTPMGRLLKTKNQLTDIKHKMQLNLHQERQQKSSKEKEVELESDTYFKILFYGCMATILWSQIWIVFLCFIPITFYGLKQLCKVLGIFTYLEEQWTHRYLPAINTWLEPRRSAIVPFWLPGVRQLNSKVHKFFCVKLKSFVDDISAIVMILFLIFFVIFLGIFFFFQIYSETIAVAQLGSNLINRTLVLRPDLVEMLPISMQSMNDVIDNAYKYSRGTIEDYLDSVFNETNPEQATKLKTQILSVWDRLIQSYMDRNNEGIGPRVPSESVLTTLDEIVTTSGVTYSGIFAWAKSNLHVLMEVSDSLWIVLKANLNLLFSTLTTFFGVILGGGHQIFKFLFNSIIFFTTLYYLLQSSKDRYAPIAMNINSTWGTRLADALEDSISSVLVATMKLSLFHGLFTWLTHTVFGAHVVYLPAILASILAAAPFLECYWCSVPAFLDLWLSQDRFYLGLVLFLIHFIVPSNFNPVVHSEIKGGGHPYLTALSIVGGMYLFGIEGAVLGPLLLCLLVVLSTITVKNLNTPTNSYTHQSSDDGSNSIATPATDWEYKRSIEGVSALDTTI